jgi:hypothetical protein
MSTMQHMRYEEPNKFSEELIKHFETMKDPPTPPTHEQLRQASGLVRREHMKKILKQLNNESEKRKKKP